MALLSALLKTQSPIHPVVLCKWQSWKKGIDLGQKRHMCNFFIHKMLS